MRKAQYDTGLASQHNLYWLVQGSVCTVIAGGESGYCADELAEWLEQHV